MAFTKKQPRQQKKTAYAQSAQLRAIRQQMMKVITEQCTSCDLKALVVKFTSEAISKEMESAAQRVFPIQNVFIRKVKLIRDSPSRVAVLAAMHDSTKVAEAGRTVERKEETA
eukprot:gnl/Ergobibamus_cyprinoides/2675.p1 GENE.gnl/Ergobibamus_cyprinoides/2675~~gnl/Ergobibamus_cyprinoides/2675.p1  ORF type:complete len:128 (+),score=62.44 gnl/Ergobibamus_cyprinoides/2675:47-385(+)